MYHVDFFSKYRTFQYAILQLYIYIYKNKTSQKIVYIYLHTHNTVLLILHTAVALSATGGHNSPSRKAAACSPI